mmetsp:Transcript_21236/g.27376  ORF Transcript_21236/g.27376 Transcript_21236/m.27376 type:complete len:221 (+) Transcript_21236:885-1547(+)
MTMTSIYISNRSLIVANACSHQCAAIAFQCTFWPIDFLSNQVFGPNIWARFVQILGKRFRRRRPSYSTSNINAQTFFNIQVWIVFQNFRIVPCRNVTLKDFSQDTIRQVQPSGPIRHIRNGMKHTNSTKNKRYMKHTILCRIQRSPVFIRHGNITRTKISVGNVVTIFSKKLRLSLTRSNSSVGHMKWLLSLFLHPFHNMPDAFGWIRSSTAMQFDDVTC